MDESFERLSWTLWELLIMATQQTKPLAEWDTLGRLCRLKQSRSHIGTHPCVASWKSHPISYINLFMPLLGKQRCPDILCRSLNKFRKANYVNRCRIRYVLEGHLQKKSVFLWPVDRVWFLMTWHVYLNFLVSNKIWL